MATGVDSGGQGVVGLWQAITPAAGTNLCTNPSLELNTTGWVTSAGTMTRTAGAGVFGAYGGRLLASSTNGNTYFQTAGSVAAGTIVTASVWIKADSPLVQLWLHDGLVSLTVSHPGDGQWHRLEKTYTWTSTTWIRAYVIDTRTGSWTNVDFDGMDIETGVSAATIYIDGDQDGCTWTGTPHASTSTRDGRDGRGGAITTIDQPGYMAAGSYQVREFRGIGMPEVNVSMTDLALADGGSYQRSRGQSRAMSLFYILQGNGTPAGLHTARRSLLSILNPDNRTNRGPITLRYIGSSSPRIIAAYYAGGLEWGEIKGLTEEPEVKFTAPDPIWQSETEESAALTVGQTLTPVSGFARRLADGTWSTMGGGITAAASAYLNVAQTLLDGRVVVGGSNYADIGGGAANDNMAVWDGSAWGTLGGAAPNGSVTASALGLDGKLYIAGTFTTVGGVTVTRIAQWTPSTNTWAIVGTGGATASFGALAIDPATGYLWAAGQSVGTVGGVSIGGIAYWNGTTWTNASTGVPGGWAILGPQALTAGPDGRMYAAFGANGVYVWTGSTWSAVATTNSGGPITLLSTHGRLYVGGIFTTIGGVTVSNIAEISSAGSGISSMAGGTGAGAVRGLAATPDGLIHAAGDSWGTIGGITPPDSLATWNGSSWAPFAADPPNTGTHANDFYMIHGLRDGSVMVGWSAASGTFGTSLSAEAITSVTNSGTANAYPVIELAGPLTLYSIQNLTTGQRISFSGCTLATSETARLDLRPGRKTFGALLRNLISTVLPGSDLSTFCLAPGANRIAMYATGGTATIRFRDRFWSAD